MVQAKPKVYLAGPDVFCRDALLIGRAKRAICAHHGLDGLFPLDAGLTVAAAPAEAVAIFRANARLIAEADGAIANLTPFRGPNADDGTAFEIGQLLARDVPVFAYLNTSAALAERVEHAGATGVTRDAASGLAFDADGMFIENHGLPVNLMLACGIAAGGGRIFTRDVAEPDRYTDLSLFEQCAAALARHFRERRGAAGFAAAM
jgi:nucleoside 2-deoxyribosyltransferase